MITALTIVFIVAAGLSMTFAAVRLVQQLEQPSMNSPDMVRPIGTSGKTRSPILPDAPTLDEAGAPGFQASLWVGFMAPKDTPQPIVDLLNRNITSILQRPDIKKNWADQGATALVMTQPEFAAFMQAEIVKWAKVIKANHIALID